MVIFWGTEDRIKKIGFRGDKIKCENCYKSYIPCYYRRTVYDHFCAIPVSEITHTYKSVCPICGYDQFVQTFRFTEIANTTVTKEMQDISYIAVQKDKHKYDFVAMDNLTQEQILIAQNVSMFDIKEGIRRRGGKTKDLIIVV